MGWNLPPGCTQADIDRAYGGNEPRCDACGKETEELEPCWYKGHTLWLCAKSACWPPEDRDDD